MIEVTFEVYGENAVELHEKAVEALAKFSGLSKGVFEDPRKSDHVRYNIVVRPVAESNNRGVTMWRGEVRCVL